MEILVQTGELLRETGDLAVLLSSEDTALPADVADLLEPADFRGKAKQTLLLYPRGAIGPRRLLLVGLGKHETMSADHLRQAAAIAVKQAQAMQVAAFTLGYQWRHITGRRTRSPGAGRRNRTGCVPLPPLPNRAFR